MKKIIGIGLLMATCLTFGQKKTNGTIYIDHPGIVAVEAMTQARVSGDAAKVASYLATDFKYYSGTNPNETIQGKDKVAFAEQNKWMNDNISYYSISRSKGAYPDAFEYKRKDESYDVHTWENVKGMHNKTGVKIDMPVHSIYTLDKNNKIISMIVYATNKVMDEIYQGATVRRNGVIYNHHENINTVRKMIYSFFFMDLEKGYSFFDEKATFQNNYEKQFDLARYKAIDIETYKNYDVVSAVEIGYPDYLEYEIGGGNSVLSWWEFNFVRKSDKKSIVVQFHLNHSFNKDGKIISEAAYFNSKLFDDK